MYASISCSQALTVEQVIHQIMALGKISKLDQDLLRSISRNGLTDAEQKLMAGLQKALHLGRLAVV
jgi:hypothetical protein